MADIKLGTAVTYISGKGDKKLAFVLGTTETVTPDRSIPVPQEGFLHLEVHSLTGKTYMAYSVPSADVANDDYKDENGEFIKVWRPIS